MMRQRLPALALAILAIQLTSGAGKTFAATDEPALKLKQTHYALGDNVVTVAPDGVRIQNVGRFRFIVVARAPSWQVTVFREDDKIYYTETLAEFEDTGLMSSYVMGFKPRFLNPPEYRRSRMNFLNYPIMRVTAPRATLKYLPLGHYATQPVERIIYMAYKVPTCGGLPLYSTGTGGTRDWVSQTSNIGRFQTYLTTSEITPIDVSPAIFSAPKNYRKAKSLREVVAGSDIRAESEYALESMRPRGSKESTKEPPREKAK